MATTRIIPMHVNKGSTVAKCLEARTDYAKNPEKTNGGELVSSFMCTPECVDTEFLLSKLRYAEVSGRNQKSDVIAYQVRQSFQPGTVSPEEANRIGYEFAERFTKGNHAFIVATHIDKAHVHNHIIWNSTTLDCSRKYKEPLRSGRHVRELSDMICLEHGLSIIEAPSRKGYSYNKWQGENRKLSNRDRLREAIEATMKQNPATLAEFIMLLKNAGYEIKNGKELSARHVNDQRFIRFSSLGNDYSKDEIIAAILGEKYFAPLPRYRRQEQRVNLLIDIEAKLQAGKGGGYQRWASVFNAKQLAKTINYLRNSGCSTYLEFSERAAHATERYEVLSERIRSAEARLKEISSLRTQIINYAKTKDIFDQYKANHYSRAFLEEHESEIILHRTAKKYFNEMGIAKLPSVKQLNEEYNALLADKRSVYPEYLQVRDEMRELLAVKANVDRILQLENEEIQRASTKRERDR